MGNGPSVLRLPKRCVMLPQLETFLYFFLLFLGQLCEGFISRGCEWDFIRGAAGSKAEPEARLFIVLADTAPLFIKPSDRQLCPDIALISSHAIPLQRFHVIPWHALSLRIKFAKVTILPLRNQILQLAY